MLGKLFRRAATAPVAAAPPEKPAPAPVPVRDPVPLNADGERRAMVGMVRPVAPLPPSGSLTESLERFLSRPEVERLSRPDALHVSAMHDMCTRRVVLEREAPSTRSITWSERIRWDIGHAVQQWASVHYFGPMGILWGDWQCVACLTVMVGQMPVKCLQCGRTDAWRYLEYEAVNDELGIVGHLDGLELIVTPGGYDFGVLELKTAGPEQYRMLAAARAKPLEQHVAQVKMYCWLSMCRRARIVYFSTRYEKGAPVRDFVLTFSDKEIAELEQEVRAKIAQIRDGGVRSCATPAEVRALLCPKRRPCFGLP